MLDVCEIEKGVEKLVTAVRGRCLCCVGGHAVAVSEIMSHAYVEAEVGFPAQLARHTDGST